MTKRYEYYNKMQQGVGTEAVQIGGYTVPADSQAVILNLTVANTVADPQNATDPNIGISVWIRYDKTDDDNNVANAAIPTTPVTDTEEDATASRTDSDVALCRHLSLPAGMSIVLAGAPQKLVLEAGESIWVESSQATSADVIMSIMEITEDT